ncbi:MAG: DUF3794 domain-containing protein [Romboutsia sp.]
MENEIIKFGVTELDNYPLCVNKNYCKQVIENDILLLPCKKPNIECIDSIFVSACVKDFKIIKTILGYKIIIRGTKKYKIMYTADNSLQSVHSVSFEKSFFEFILLDKLECRNIKDIFIGIEDIIVNCYDCRNIDIILLFIIYPIITLD